MAAVYYYSSARMQLRLSHQPSRVAALLSVAALVARLAGVGLIILLLDRFTSLDIVVTATSFVVPVHRAEWRGALAFRRRSRPARHFSSPAALGGYLRGSRRRSQARSPRLSLELNVQVIWQGPKIGPFDMSITNAVIYMWVSAIVVFVFFFIVSQRLKKEPDGLQTVAEILLNFATGHLTGQIGEKGKKYYYLILTLFMLHLHHEPHRPHPQARVPQAVHARRRTST